MSSTWQSRSSAVREAREFVRSNSFGTLSTINQGSHEFGGFPAGQVEYYSDNCDVEASLLLIRVDMSSAFRNIELGSPCSLAIRTGDAPKAVTPLNLANNHRIILYGEFEDYKPTQVQIDRFLRLHPDAEDWRPGKVGFHRTFWTKFVITGIYYIGGFGGEHYIGKLPVEEYKEVNSYGDEYIDEKTALLPSDRPVSWLSRFIAWVWPI